MIFEANSLFVHTVHFQRGDLSYVLKEGDKVTVEVTEFSGGKERKRMFAKVRIYKSQFHYYLCTCLAFFETFGGIIQKLGIGIFFSVKLPNVQY